MFFKFSLSHIQSELHKQFKNYQRIKLFASKIHEIKFLDLNQYFPRDYFLIDFEPLYTFMHIIKCNAIVNLSVENEQDELLFKNLQNLFTKKEYNQRIYFSDFSGETNSKSKGNISFDIFKKQQFERCKNDSKTKYVNYDIVRHDVFNIVSPVDANPIKSAILLKWSSKWYAKNNNKSHRFALLCEWNEIENRCDSENFEIIEYSFNDAAKTFLKENYYGFMMTSKNASDVVSLFHNCPKLEWWNYRIAFGSGDSDIVCLFFKKALFVKYLNIIDSFMNDKNIICINKLLE